MKKIGHKSTAKVFSFGFGFAVHRAANILVASIISPILVSIFSIGVSIILVSMISLTKSLILIWAYDKSKRDWLRIEAKKKKQERKKIQKNKTEKRREKIWRRRKRKPFSPKKESKIKKVTRAILFILLVVWDPTITILYYRSGYHTYNGIPRRSVSLFIFSVLASSIVWVLALSFLIKR